MKKTKLQEELEKIQLQHEKKIKEIIKQFVLSDEEMEELEKQHNQNKNKKKGKI